MKIIKHISLLLLLFWACDNATSQDSKPITDFDADKNATATLVDVRTPEEFAAGHLPKAKNINVFNEDFVTRFAKYDKEETIYLYCRSGSRSARAQKMLKEAGFLHVINLEGGFLAWKAAGKAVE